MKESRRGETASRWRHEWTVNLLELTCRMGREERKKSSGREENGQGATEVEGADKGELDAGERNKIAE